MLKQFTNLSSALCRAVAKRSVAHGLTPIRLSLPAVPLPLRQLTFLQNLRCKITKVHTSPRGIEATFPGQSL